MASLGSGTREADRKCSRSRVVRLQYPVPYTLLNAEANEITAHKLISAVVCDAQKNFIAAGIENPDDGPGVSPVYVW